MTHKKSANQMLHIIFKELQLLFNKSGTTLRALFISFVIQAINFFAQTYSVSFLLFSQSIIFKTPTTFKTTPNGTPIR